MLLNLSFEKTMLSSPHYVFWKDKNSVYLGCNQNFAELLGFGSPESVIGKSDYELCWQKSGDGAEVFRQGDIKTMNGILLTNVKEHVCVPNKTLIFLVNKRPLINKSHKTIGVFGVSVDVSPPEITVNSNLTKRQLECLCCLVHGMTAKQIGNVLNISYRTVEYYLEVLKEKFECANKSDLIAKAVKMGFGNI